MDVCVCVSVWLCTGEESSGRVTAVVSVSTADGKAKAVSVSHAAM